MKVFSRSLFAPCLNLILIALATPSFGAPSATPAQLEKNRLIVPAIAKPHPRLVLDSAGVAAMRQRALSDREPFTSAWIVLQKRLAKPVAPTPYIGASGLEFVTVALDQGGHARDLALAWEISGEERYAQQAIHMLRAWAEAQPLPGTAFEHKAGEKDETPNWGMNAARSLFPFAYAYDLLYNQIDEPTRHVVEGWFRALLPVIQKCEKHWIESDYYGSQYFNNHVMAQTLGYATIGIILGDQDLLQLAIDDPRNPRDFREMVVGLIFMKGDEPCIRDKAKLPAPETGEIYDRFRHHTGKGLRGIQYCNLSLSLLAALTEITQTATDLPLWKYQAPSGENIRLPFEYYSEFYLQMDSSVKSGYYKGETDRLGRAGDSPALYELGLARFPDSVPLRNMLKTKDRATLSQELFGPLVLTHGITIP